MTTPEMTLPIQFCCQPIFESAGPNILRVRPVAAEPFQVDVAARAATVLTALGSPAVSMKDVRSYALLWTVDHLTYDGALAGLNSHLAQRLAEVIPALQRAAAAS